MVKNKSGGNKTKGMARKNMQGGEDKVLRLSTSPYEIYAYVDKINGNGMCDVYCIDGKDRLCHVRGIFRGRARRDNYIEKGAWLLVGLRDYETPKKDKKENCDLLEVYNKSEKDKLRNTVLNVKWNTFIARDNVLTQTVEDLNDVGQIKFADATEQEYLDLMVKIKTDTTATEEATEIIQNEAMVDIFDL